jgi:hypothetical protein
MESPSFEKDSIPGSTNFYMIQKSELAFSSPVLGQRTVSLTSAIATPE